MPEKPTLVFVPGAWHTEFHVQPVLPYLKALDYRVVLLVMKTAGFHDDPKPTFRDNITMILDAIKEEIKAGREFVLLGHSAGALTSALAANEFLASASETEKAHLLNVIFLAGFINTSRHIITHWHHIDWEGGYSYAWYSDKIFYNDMSLEESKPYTDALVPMVIVQRPDEVDKYWLQVKRTFIVCLQDQAILPDKQKLEAEENGMEVVEIDTGHCPFISKPEFFANELDKVVMQSKGKEKI